MARMWLCSIVGLAALSGCAPKVGGQVEASANNQLSPPKNVILIIGDGMGPQQVGLLELYARKAPSKPYAGRTTSFTRMANTGSFGMSMHDPADFLVTDSACSATQLALGVPAPVEALGVDRNGDPQKTVLERAKAAGRATGLVSDTRLTHATPAAFASHLASRSDEGAVASQMLAVGPDVMLSGGMANFVPSSVEGSRRDDERDLISEAKAAGYTVATTQAELASSKDGKVLGLFSPSGMMGAIEERRTRGAADRTQPSLHQMAQAALDHLDDDEDGFFLMIEAGQIDWAGHANDTGWLLHEMVRADEMISGVLDWAEARSDTLVVVTADHETGGVGVAYSHVNLPEPRELPGSAFEGTLFAPRANYGDPAVLDRIYGQKRAWGDLLGQHAALEEPERTPAKLAEMVAAASSFTLDEGAAARVLASVPHPHAPPDIDPPLVPYFRDFAAFYPTAEYGRGGLIARELAAQQNVVWATGGHTHTPVPVYAVGPGAAAFAGMHHHTDLGVLLAGLVER